jgi:hypothetical protein
MAARGEQRGRSRGLRRTPARRRRRLRRREGNRRVPLDFPHHLTPKSWILPNPSYSGHDDRGSVVAHGGAPASSGNKGLRLGMLRLPEEVADLSMLWLRIEVVRVRLAAGAPNRRPWRGSARPRSGVDCPPSTITSCTKLLYATKNPK